MARSNVGRSWAALLLVGLLAGLTACSKPTPGDGGAGAAASATGTTGALRFWHTQTQENETALQQIVAEFNAQDPSQPPIEATYIGDYDKLFEKIRAGAAAKSASALPDLAVAYESMIAEYMAADIVRPLDDLLKDPQVGLDEASLADIFPRYLESNRFAQFGGQLLSFPFTKSNLMLYYNESMLKSVGQEPPRTWDDLLDVCRAIRKAKGIAPIASATDPSTIDGMILSLGGHLLSEDGTQAMFQEPATLEVFRLLDTLYKEQLAYQVVDKGDQNNDFANGKCAMFFRSSTARPFVADLVAGKFAWNMVGLPVKQGRGPQTIMFGANICVMKSTPEREKRGWEFIKHFTSTAVTARWAQATGYLPVRKSAAESPEMKTFFAAAPQNQAAFDLLPVAVTEPNVAGWQSVRNCLEAAETSIATQVGKPDQVVKDLDQCADKALKSATQ